MHVANATNSAIWVKCDCERSYVHASKFHVNITKGKDGISAGKDYEYTLDWNKITTGFTRIQPGQCLNFDMDEDGKKIVYISIFLESEGKFIADALPSKIDKNMIIITRRGEIKDAQLGTVWVDESGWNHEPSRHKRRNIVRHKNKDKKLQITTDFQDHRSSESEEEKL